MPKQKYAFSSLNQEESFYILAALIQIQSNAQNILDQVSTEMNAQDILELAETIQKGFARGFMGNSELKEKFIEYAHEKFGLEIEATEEEENGKGPRGDVTWH